MFCRLLFAFLAFVVGRLLVDACWFACCCCVLFVVGCFCRVLTCVVCCLLFVVICWSLLFFVVCVSGFGMF